VRRAYAIFSGHFGTSNAVFVPPFNRITRAMLRPLAKIGFAAVSLGPRRLERKLAGSLSIQRWLPRIRLPTSSVPAPIDIQVDLIDWKMMTSRDPARIAGELVGYLSVRRNGFVDPRSPIGLLTHHIVHDERIWATCDELLTVIRSHRATEFMDLPALLVEY